MRIFDLVRLIVWVCLSFWLVWYVSVQTERLNSDVFGKLKNAVLVELEKSSGALRLFGIALYSPYIKPVASIVIWLLIVIMLIVF